MIIGAKDGGDFFSSNNVTFTIQLVATNFSIPKFMKRNWNVIISENMPLRTSLGVFAATAEVDNDFFSFDKYEQMFLFVFYYKVFFFLLKNMLLLFYRILLYVMVCQQQICLKLIIQQERYLLALFLTEKICQQSISTFLPLANTQLQQKKAHYLLKMKTIIHQFLKMEIP